MKAFYFYIPPNQHIPLAPEDQPPPRGETRTVMEVSGMAAVAIANDEIEAREVLTEWAEGDVLWISTTEVGKLTNVEPTSGLKMPIAFVVTSHLNVGEIMVRITPIDENRFLSDTFETVSKNLKASDYELTYNEAGDLTVITYANGIIKTLGYLGSGDLGTITLSGATPGGIDLVKTLTYNESGDLESVAYS